MLTEIPHDQVFHPGGPAPEQDCTSGTTNGDLERIQFNAISINEFRDVADQSNVELQALRFKWRREVRLQAFGQPRTIWDDRIPESTFQAWTKLPVPIP